MTSFVNRGPVYNQAGGDINIENQHIHQGDGHSTLFGLVAPQAAFNASGKDDDPLCLPNTRVKILQEIRTWIDGNDNQYIFWLSGWAGTGKSTIARTVAREYLDKNRFMASFFFSRDDNDVRRAEKFVGTVATQLAERSDKFKSLLENAISNDKGISARVLKDQWNVLVLQPLSQLEPGSFQQPLLIVIDALDECEKEGDVRQILYLLTNFRQLSQFSYRVFITSRPEIPIQHGFSIVPGQDHQDFILHNIPRSIVDDDIFKYLEHGLRDIQRKQALGEDWPLVEDITHLVRKAAGLFIWAATACRFIDEGGSLFSSDRLSDILNGDSSNTDPEEELNEIYTKVLENVIMPRLKQHEKDKVYTLLREALGAIVTLYSPLSAHSLAQLLERPEQDIYGVLRGLHSILDVPRDPSLRLRLHHPSFRDFLIHTDRCKDSNFQVNEMQAHQMLAERCMRLMSTALKQDICRLDTPGVLVAEVESGRVEKSLPPEVQYACLYWVEHLQKGRAQVHDDDQVHKFLRSHFLHWLEALSWMRRISEGILAITSLEAIAVIDQCPTAHEFVHDMKRFALYNRPAIEQTPLQLYHSALAFAPKLSLVRRQFIDQMPKWLWKEWIRKLPDVQNDWGALVQTLEGHSASVNNVSFSPDGRTLASASNDSTVKLWDASTGKLLQTLEGHSTSVRACSFSMNCKLLVSLSSDREVRVWDTSTGEVLMTLMTFIESAFTSAGIAYPGDELQVSASNDETIRLWNTVTRVVLRILKGHSDEVKAVAFSRDGKTLSSVSGDKTVKLWDTSSGKLLQKLEIDSVGWIEVATFSPDIKMLALVLESADEDELEDLEDEGDTEARILTLEERLLYMKNRNKKRPEKRSWGKKTLDEKNLDEKKLNETAKLWDISSGRLLQTLPGHSASVKTLCFSPDGKTLASASSDDTIKLWDISSAKLLKTLKKDWKRVNAMAFSSDSKVLASALTLFPERVWLGGVRLWDASSGSLLHKLFGHLDQINAVAFSPDGKTLASASSDETIKLWDTNSVKLLKTLKVESMRVNALAFSSDSKVLASASDSSARNEIEGEVKLWDTGSGRLLRRLGSYSASVNTIAFSPYCKILVLALSDKTIRLWDAGVGAVLQTLRGYLNNVSTASISSDGKLLVSSGGGIVKVWDTSTRDMLHEFGSLWRPQRTDMISSDGNLRAEILDSKMVKLCDTAASVAPRTLEGHSDRLTALAFSPNTKLLASASVDKTVRLWDTSTRTALPSLESHWEYVSSLAFSPDGKMLGSASNDKTVMLWDTETGKLLRTLVGHSDFINAIVFSPDSKQLASASMDKTIRLRKVDDGVAVLTLKGHLASVDAISFKPDSNVLASASSDGTVKLWDMRMGWELLTMKGHLTTVSALAFSPDTMMLASASDGTVMLHDCGIRTLLRARKGPWMRVNSLAFSPDSKILASASDDKTIKMWDVVTRQLLQTLQIDYIIQSMSFSNDGTLLQTNRGLLRIATSRPHLPSSVFIKEQWVCRGMDNVIWLPPEHRPSHVAVYGGIVAFGYPSGRVSFMKFCS